MILSIIEIVSRTVRQGTYIESDILFWIEHLKQGGRRIAVIV
jgi:hypothetical protein